MHQKTRRTVRGHVGMHQSVAPNPLLLWRQAAAASDGREGGLTCSCSSKSALATSSSSSVGSWSARSFTIFVRAVNMPGSSSSL